MIEYKHSDEGNVKIYSKSEMLSILSTDFHKIEWEHINLTSSITIARKHAMLDYEYHQR